MNRSGAKSVDGRTTVLHLSSSSGPGGAEMVVASVASALDPARYRSVVCLFRDGWLRERCEHLGLETHILHMRGMLDLHWLRQFHALLRKCGVAVIHAHEFGANTWGTMAGRLARRPVVATVHGRSYYADSFRRRLAYRVVSRAAVMVSVSEDIKRFLVEAIGVSPRHVHVVHNGIGAPVQVSLESQARVRTELGLRDGQHVVTVIGNLYPVKGHRYLLEAAPQILARHPSTLFLFAGRGECETELREQARHLGIEAQVRFLGLRKDVPVLLTIGDVFVQPSLSEGLSIAILEAMAAAKPVVATSVGGNPELVVEGETGLLVAPANADALATAIIRVLSDIGEARRLASNALARAQSHFSIAGMVRRYETLYQAALGRTARPASRPDAAMADRLLG